LIQEGLAQCYEQGSEKRMPLNFDLLKSTEEKVKTKEIGIWTKSLKLVSEHKNNPAIDKFGYLERITVEMSNLIDGREFYLRILDKNYNYEKIDSMLANFDPNKAE
jgi:hypothetical protein